MSLNMECNDLRSRDYGSPQCRQRLYIVGVQCSLVSPSSFDSMVQWLRNYLADVHHYSSIRDVIRWVAVRCEHPPTVCGSVQAPTVAKEDPPTDSYPSHQKN